MAVYQWLTAIAGAGLRGAQRERRHATTATAAKATAAVTATGTAALRITVGPANSIRSIGSTGPWSIFRTFGFSELNLGGADDVDGGSVF
ncbi:MAG: hypothetical protein JSS97_00490 [Actinobacteria bacterium]|nr:hypothetical protein [Actinomycetota bacterium]